MKWHAARRNKSVKWDYKIGEDVWTPGRKGGALRYMDDPKKDGYSIDNYRDYPKQAGPGPVPVRCTVADGRPARHDRLRGALPWACTTGCGATRRRT